MRYLLVLNLTSNSNLFCGFLEVMKGLWAKKQAKMKKSQSESAEKPERVKEKPDSLPETAARRSQPEEDNHVKLH